VAPPRWRTSDAAAGAALALLAFAVRALPWRRVLEPDRVVWHGNDAYYHARRVAYTLEDFPRLLERDPYINHPHGGEPIWSPLFDLTAASLAWVLGLSQDLAAVERLLVWIPPLLGATTVVLAAALARRVGGRLAGVLAGLLLALLPAHFNASRVGYLDHHAAVSLASTALLAGTLVVLSRRRASAATLGMLGVCLGAALLLWPGMLLELALVELGLASFLLVESDARRAHRLALGMAGTQLGALAVVAPFALGRDWERWGSFSPLVLSDFQPWLLGAAAVAFAIYAWRVGAAGRLSPSRRYAALGLGLTGALLTLLPFAGELPAALQTALDWLGRREAFQAEVAESRPLLVRRGRIDPGFALQQLTGLVFLAPLWLGFGIARARASLRPAPWLFLTGFAAALLAVTLAQTRFSASLAPAMAVLVGLSAAAWIRRGRGLVVTLVGLALCAPALASYGPLFADQAALLRGEPPALGAWAQRHRLLLELAGWLRESTPVTPGWLDARARPGYGVLSHWADGHALEYVARRPTVVTNFGDDVGAQNLQLAEAYYRAEEPEASALLDRLAARYVVFEYRRTASRRELAAGSMLSRLYFADGAEAVTGVEIRDGRARRVRGAFPAVTRHRLVYETAAKSHAPDPARPGFKVYEHVRGAEIVGAADAGARVEARLELETPRRSFGWAASTRADLSGRYRLRVPYATGGSPPPVRPTARYRLRSGSQSSEVAVPEAAVLEGRRLAGPDLRTSGPGAAPADGSP
jgi:dolichyl-diphosphooligosaccharide--protein glycosyltransferase